LVKALFSKKNWRGGKGVEKKGASVGERGRTLGGVVSVLTVFEDDVFDVKERKRGERVGCLSGGSQGRGEKRSLKKGGGGEGGH